MLQMLLQVRDPGLLIGKDVRQFAEEVAMRAALPVGRSFGRVLEELHAGGVVVPEKRGVDEPPVFLDIEGVTATFFFTDGEVVFAELESGDRGGQDGGGPTEDGLGIGGESVGRFVADERDEEGVFIDDDGASPAEAAEDGDGGRELIKMDECFWFAGDAHDDGRGCAGVDKAKVASVTAKQLLF